MPPKKSPNGKTKAQIPDLATSQIVLTPSELSGLRYRWDMWQGQRQRAHDERVIADILAEVAPADSSDLRWQIAQRQGVRAHNEEMVEAVLQDTYGDYARTLRSRYSLPPQYNVDWDTGLITPAESVDG
jgi:hypothetical protein